jgi:hypothetical protein
MSEPKPTYYGVKILQYINKTKMELVFHDSSFLTCEHLPLNYMKLCKKQLIVDENGVFLGFLKLATLNGRHVTWTSNEIKI